MPESTSQNLAAIGSNSIALTHAILEKNAAMGKITDMITRPTIQHHPFFQCGNSRKCFMCGWRDLRERRNLVGRGISATEFLASWLILPEPKFQSHGPMPIPSARIASISQNAESSGSVTSATTAALWQK